MRYRPISLLILLFGAFLTIFAYAQGDPECERIQKAKSDDRAALIDEIIKFEYAKPNLQGRLGAGLVCLAALGDEEQNKVFLELLSKASAISRSHTAWFIAVKLKVKPSEEVFGALRNLIGWTKPDGDRQDATHWSREALVILAIIASVFVIAFGMTTYRYYQAIHSDDPINPYLAVEK